MASESLPHELMLSVFKAYLKPLLEKHELDHMILYEDLSSSWDAAKVALTEGLSKYDAQEVEKVKAKVTALHKEQVQAYQTEGKKELTKFARTLPLIEGDPSTDSSYVVKCVRHALAGAPGWKLPRSTTLSILQKNLQERIASRKAEMTKASDKPTGKDTEANDTTTTNSSITKEAAPLSTIKETEEGSSKKKDDKKAATNSGEATKDAGNDDDDEEEEGEVEEEEGQEEGAEIEAVEDGEEAEGGEEQDGAQKTGEKAAASEKPKRKGLLAKKKAMLNKTTAAKKKQQPVGKGTKTAVKRQPTRRVGKGGGKA